MNCIFYVTMYPLLTCAQYKCFLLPFFLLNAWYMKIDALACICQPLFLRTAIIIKNCWYSGSGYCGCSALVAGTSFKSIKNF
jgi:hypothetical protein